VIGQSVDALAVFVDAVMIHDQLPVFHYGASWEPELAGSSATLVEFCNRDEELLAEVHVDGEAYQRARKPAVEALQALPQVDPRLVSDIRDELSTFDYRWRPRLVELDEAARLIASFRYGGLLFHEYAEAISDRRQPLDRWAEHVLHAKRSPILLATSLAPDGGLRLDEQKLMRTLRRVERDTNGAIEAVDLTAPTFLPYLLAQEPRSPRHLLQLALRQRRSSLVRSYRDWWLRLLSDLANGRLRQSTRNELQAIAAETQRKGQRQVRCRPPPVICGRLEGVAGSSRRQPCGAARRRDARGRGRREGPSVLTRLDPAWSRLPQAAFEGCGGPGRILRSRPRAGEPVVSRRSVVAPRAERSTCGGGRPRRRRDGAVPWALPAPGSFGPTRRRCDVRGDLVVGDPAAARIWLI
jgi:hypothetical protein